MNNNEPIHIHCIIANSECKFWIDVDNYDLLTAYAFNCSQRDLRDIRKIVFNHFDYIIEEWNKFMEATDE